MCGVCNLHTPHGFGVKIMQHGLYEILAGKYADGTPVSMVPGNEDIQRSIRDHLTRLLNARQGVLLHQPDYGLPDIANIYHQLPYSVSELSESIKRTVLKYEPRLADVTVNYRPIEKSDCILHLEIKAKLTNGSNVLFETFFMSGGYAEVRAGRFKRKE